MATIKLTVSELETLNSRGYKLLSKIGEGAYTKVYLSTYEHKGVKSALACKIVDVQTSSSMYIHKFLPRELEILMKIKDPNIIHIHSIFRKHLKYYIFMRFAEKGDLMEYIVENGAVPELQSRLWSKQISSAIQYLHHHYIAHRDIKCENLLITDNKNLKLTDFGFSRYINCKDKRLRLSETYCGSLLYVAPEIVRGIAYDPFKSDLWSLGVVIFTMLNRMVPFNETNPSLMYELQIKQKYKFRSADPALDLPKSLIKKLLQPSPQKRPSVDEVLQNNWFTKELESDELLAIENAKQPLKNPDDMSAREADPLDKHISSPADEKGNVESSTFVISGYRVEVISKELNKSVLEELEMFVLNDLDENNHTVLD